jgi:murein DD-endopeptidase MepM/ murein hydrolase activator NlpD
MQYPISRLLFICALQLITTSLSAQKPAGGGHYQAQASECVPESLRLQIEQDLKKNIAELKAAGKLKPTKKTRAVGLEWPLKQATGFDYCSYYGVSNFVDHNTNYPNLLEDYNCGTRTYDLNTGYNHGGIDIFLWPFDWNMKNANQVEIIAAAPGVIVGKYDGNPDTNCNFSNPNWNAVYIQHSDGSIAWYGHMKTGSTTTKPLGATVVSGEKIGLIGSSGSSSGPHLHFELHDAANNLIDPYNGSCNQITSWWNNQKPYYEPTINAALTHKSPPVFNPCPAPATTNIKDTFAANDTLYVCGYFHDQQQGQIATYTIYRPDNSVFSTWTHSPNQTYAASYWYWYYILPNSPMLGTWRFQVQLQGQTCEHAFEVIDPFIAAGINETSMTKFIMSPNPARHFLNVQYAIFPIELYSMFGQKVGEFNPNTTIDISNVPNGIYLLKSGVQYQKLVIQH